MHKKMKGLSLFANVGVAETYLQECGIDIVLANEIDKKRADFYTHVHPSTEMIVGDITNDVINKKVIEKLFIAFAIPDSKDKETIRLCRNNFINYSM